MSKYNVAQIVGLAAVSIGIIGLLLYMNGYFTLPMLQSEGFQAEEEVPAEEEEGFEDEEKDKEKDAKEGFANGGTAGCTAAATEEFEDAEEGFMGGYDQGRTEYAPAGSGSGQKSVPSSDYANCYTRDGLNPNDLLPKASPQAAQFLASNPPSAGSPDKRNLLEAGYHIGVDTVCQSNKNPNLQLRSDPPIARTGPQPIFNASTIPFVQNNRRVLEVGSQLNPEGCASFK